MQEPRCPVSYRFAHLVSRRTGYAATASAPERSSALETAATLDPGEPRRVTTPSEQMVGPRETSDWYQVGKHLYKFDSRCAYQRFLVKHEEAQAQARADAAARVAQARVEAAAQAAHQFDLELESLSSSDTSCLSPRSPGGNKFLVGSAAHRGEQWAVRAKRVHKYDKLRAAEAAEEVPRGAAAQRRGRREGRGAGSGLG
jgi:hypothetical protein